MSIIAYAIAVLAVFVILKIISLPMKIIIRIIINSIIGGVIIYGLSFLGIGITVTWLTAAIVGVLGIPGVIIVVIMQFLL